MWQSKVFIKRFIILAILLNLPPVLTFIFMSINLQPVLLIASLVVWANVPLMAGLDGLFEGSSIVYGQFGVMDVSAMVLFSIVTFWLLCAALLAAISLVFFKQNWKCIALQP